MALMMYKVTFSTTYTDSFYAGTAGGCVAILAKLKEPKIIKIEYAYKHLGMYWKLGQCWFGWGGMYQTFRQLSKDWFKVAGGPRMKMNELEKNFDEALIQAKKVA
jgi:hypothetical protein